ncbi:hypothetical protein BH23ACT8_BH23ACT8_10860 [soil metagenome]
MDDELAAEARRRGMPKAALIRLLLRDGVAGPCGNDPLDAVIGRGDGHPVDDIDAAIYVR